VTDGWELTGIPYTSARRPGGIAGAIAVLRSSGLAERLAALGVRDAGDLDLEPPSGERGPSGLLNEAALGSLVAATRERVRAARRRGVRSLLVGGDCPVMLGAVAALAEEGDAGLVMLDGHEDAWPPGLSSTGEASDSELAIALGLVRECLPAPLDEVAPLLEHRNVALLGPRDRAEVEAGGARSIRDRVAYFMDGEALQLAPTGEPVLAAMEAIGASTFWLHVDLDVLSPQALSAVDYPQPGGLDWTELRHLARPAVHSERCAGASIVIYNPDRDPARSAAPLVVDFACHLLEA
jgi:arginase